MSYHDLLHQYGREQPQAETRVHIFAQAPRKLTTPDEIAYRDKAISQDIKRLEKLVGDLKDYRRALAARYAELETLPYTYLLKLERVPHWKGHIEYVITLTKTLSDGTKRRTCARSSPAKTAAPLLPEPQSYAANAPAFPTKKISPAARGNKREAAPVLDAASFLCSLFL